uniref:Uncharacterized protein n=1 Tax=Moniliophthora roreri TaxID=221103 RepID=A0A0W0FE89_MONRR
MLKGNLVATKTVKEDESDAKIAQLEADLKVLEAELKDLKHGAAPMEKAPVATTIDQAQFLLCKHFVRKAGETEIPTLLLFFLGLHCNHYPPYYILPGINAPEEIFDADEKEEVELVVLGSENKTIWKSHSRSLSQTSSMFDVEEIQEQLLGGKGEQGSNEKANVPKYEFEPKQGICEMPGPFDDSKIQKSMSVAGAQVAIQASIAGDPRASMAIRPMSSALSFGAAVNQAGFGAGGGYTQPEMAQTQRTIAEHVLRVLFTESMHPHPRLSRESSRTSVYERRSAVGQSRAFHQGFMPPLLKCYWLCALITTSHLNISTTTLLHYPEEDPEDAMLLKQKQGAFSLLTDNIRLKVGGMEKDEDVGPALSMMCSQSNDLTSPINKEALYTSIPTLSTPIHTCALMTESDDPMLFTASPMTPSFPSASLFTPTSTMMANLPYMPMSPDNILHAYAERQKQSQAPVLEMMERVTSPDDMLCAYVERQKAPGIESVTSLDMFILEKYVQVRKSSSCPAWEW